ncbi:MULTISPECIES: oxidoreductase [Nostoc]|uniref:SDR family NAD(P)-dependent oxidoreductase n=1 Tax=Nostoc paludosum FACHB-159 TaxID=2692908 RepID=A0ABR8K3S9_9NOSO|nr:MULTISPECIES: oxidoreductase [Nostoc]MBD2677488.1 SDR family NAD(P)-dependent oxidoreductase [Nostoc sp. FACHB-857]MBD2734119.1 SDR family NAD(P)-dependent oxidoreductase [Nostoc paludosum FACHB-159]
MVISSSIERRVWFITGSSKGLGRALAKTVLEQGDTVVLTARNPELIQDLAASFPEHTLAVQLDVTKPEEIQQAVKQAITKFGRIDVLVNNAGYGILGAIEEVSNEGVRRQFETNFFGVLEVLRNVLPYMREQRSGHIVNISSVGGFVGYAGTGIYNGTKFAIEGISEALAQEVTPLGIKITIVEPGAFRTEFVTGSLVIADNEIQDYETVIGEMRQGAQDILDNKLEFQEPGDPKKAALAIIKAVNSNNPPLRLVLGEDAISAINAKLESVKTELDAWKEVSVNTAFDELVGSST